MLGQRGELKAGSGPTNSSSSRAAPGRRIATLRSATFAWIEGWYNLRRRHSTLGGISPANYEKTPSTHRRSSGIINLSGEPGQSHQFDQR